MALKPDRIEIYTDISFFMNTVAERGGVVSVVTSGSGVSMDDANAVVEYADSASGAALGILLNDVVDKDLTKCHINWHKDEMQVGGKVTLLRRGQCTTNMVDGDPAAGDKAYAGVSGLVSTSAGGQHIGQWLSAKDEDGYAKLSVTVH